MHEFICGNAYDSLQSLPSESIHCVVTSPPYWMQRKSLVDGQIGVENHLNEYLDNLVDVFDEVYRVLRPDGTMWLNLGDVYVSDKKCRVPIGLKQKDLIGLPWRVAFELQESGWCLRGDCIWCLAASTVVYAKTQKGVMPTTIKDLVRLNPAHVQLWNGKRWTTVKGFYKTERPQTPIRLVLRSGEQIGCTENHLWPTTKGLKKAFELKVGDELVSCQLPNQTENVTNLPQTEIGWLVGTYLAEGSRGKDGKVIQIASHINEKDRFEKLCKIAKLYHGTCRMHQTSENGATINIYSKVISGIIDTYIAGNSAKSKHLTTKAWQRDNEFLEGVLCGYLEGDGHYDEKNQRWRLGFTRNELFAQNLRTICARLGYILTLNPGTAMFNNQKHLTFRGEVRKHHSDHWNTKSRTEIVEIKKQSGESFWDIEVEDEPHVFALASGILTHNSKPNAMPSAARDRPNRSHEYVFLMSKQGNYFYDQDAVMEPAVVGTRNRRSVWEINTQPSPVNHYAAFPEALAKVCIEAGTSERGCCPKCGGQVVRVTTSKRLRRDELDPSDPRYRPNRYKGAYSDINGRGDAGYTERATVGWTPSCGCDAEETAPCVVLDPFGGTGTVSKVARDLGRSSIMIDINPEYVDIAKRRLGVQERG